RAFTSFRVVINGKQAVIAEKPGGAWKEAVECEISHSLRPGQNEVTVEVGNDQGPPALWLEVKGPECLLRTDGSWTVTPEGAFPSPARRATAPGKLVAGNSVAGGERPADSLRACWPTLLLFAAIAAALVGAAHLWRRLTTQGTARQLPDL